jgi:hypothetical protein
VIPSAGTWEGGAVGPRRRVLTAPLVKPDRARRIDRIIDYFGGADGRPPTFGPVATLPARSAEAPSRRDRPPHGGV